MENFIGSIQMFGFSFPPVNWAFCGGQVVAISQNQTLFSLLGSYYGGNARTTFGYPNLTGRTPVGFNMGGGVGLTPYALGQQYGFEQITLARAQMPQHNHEAAFTPSAGGEATGTLEVQTNNANIGTPSVGNYIAAGGGAQPIFGDGTGLGVSLVEAGGLTITGGGSGGGTVSVQNTGDSQAHENRQPFQAVNFSICETGIYPSRN